MLPIRATSLLFLVLLTGSAAQQLSAQSPAPRGVVIQSRVVDASGAPIAGAAVELSVSRLSPEIDSDRGSAPIPQRTTSAADGSFEFQGAQPGGSFQLTLRHEGFAACADFGLRPRQPGLYVVPPYVLNAGEHVSGCVRDEAGQPIANAVVRLHDRAGTWEFERAEDRLHRTTDHAGRYAFGHVSPGGYTLTIHAAGFGRCAPEQIEIEAGIASTGREHVLAAAEPLAGRVFDDSGRPVAGARVWARDRQRRSSNNTVLSDQEGSFTFDALLPGTYYVTTAKPGWLSTRPVECATNSSGNDLRLERGTTVRGRVVDDVTGRPVEEFSIRLRIPSEEPTGRPLPGSELAVRHPDGEYELSGLQRWGASQLRIEALAPGYARGICAPFTMGLATVVDGVEVRMRRGATLRGRVLDSEGRPLANAFVSTPYVDRPPDGMECGVEITPPRAWRGTQTSAWTDAEGLFRLEHLNPGAYTITMLAQGHAEFLICPPPVAQGDVDVGDQRLVRGGIVHGRLLSPTGKPLRGQVHAEWLDGEPELSVAGTADRSGAFRVENLRPGRYAIRAWGTEESRPSRATDLQPWSWPERIVKVIDGESVELRLQASSPHAPPQSEQPR